jgi:hypothetical protein
MSARAAIVPAFDAFLVTAMVAAGIVLLVLWWRTARRNDRLLAVRGEPLVRADMEGPWPTPADDEEGSEAGMLPSWPYLVRIELVAALATTALLLVWSLASVAPLEQPADPSRTPDPCKAPWYFLGLQEMLAYFDPWIAGVMLPLLTIGGLLAIPWLDVNPSGNGYYSLARRRFAIGVFMLGFVGLWLLPIVVGALFRGPGWSSVWPWQAPEATVVAAPAARSWAELFGIRSAAWGAVFGALTLAAYHATAVVYWYRRRGTPALARLGPLRYGVVSFLLLTMLAVPIKVGLHVLFGVRYVLATPWLNV